MITNARQLRAIAARTGLDAVAEVLRDAAGVIDKLEHECEALRRDAMRLDWLADPDNASGCVQLPRRCVEQHPDSMRAAIDAAMKSEDA